MRSALTAALSGQPNDPATAPPEQQQQPTVSKKLDPGSFPCIQEDTISPLQSELGGLKLEDRDPVGSVPTAGLLPNGSLAVSTAVSDETQACIGRFSAEYLSCKSRLYLLENVFAETDVLHD